MTTTRQEFEQAKQSFKALIHAAKLQRDKYPEGNPNYEQFDEKIVQFERELVDTAMAADRLLARHIIETFQDFR